MLNFKWLVEDKNFKDKNCLENTITLHHQTELYETFYNYSLQFKKSANIIAHQLLTKESNISQLDTYFFPTVYLYRHSLELLLKAICLKFMEKDEEGKIYIISEEPHNLLKLYNKLSSFITDEDLSGANWLKDFFDSINKIDEVSDSFRYPFHMKSQKGIFTISVIFSEQMDIDLVKIFNKMEIAFDLLNKLFNDEKIYNDYYKHYSSDFLENGGSYYQKSVVGYSDQKEKFYPLVKSYTECADLLYSNYLNNNELKETIFLPMCYLFRNGLELSMKEILFEECNFDFQTVAKYLNSNKHSFYKLWKQIKSYLLKDISKDTSEYFSIELAEKYIQEIHDFDPRSDKFRYPTDNQLEFHFNKAIPLNLKNIYEFFLEIINFFYGVNAVLSEENAISRELEAEIRSELE